ncbi:hypothetical protein ABW19_dt0203117 [Dactylella cylindrospora]|nr:hypothetical protein ABW19_dt0203117 [Dactylella cylindrospora]
MESRDAMLISAVSLEIELFNGALSHIKAWTDTNGSHGKHRDAVINLAPFVESCEFAGPQSFDAWLASFATPSGDGELEAYRKKKAQRERPAVQAKEQPPAGPAKVYIRIENLKTWDGKIKSETLCLDRDSKIFDAIFKLNEQGYENVYGFQTHCGGHQYAPYRTTYGSLSVRVTKGPSTYNVDVGLTINEDERFIDYFNEFLDRSGMHNDQITLSRSHECGSLQVNDLRYDDEGPEVTLYLRRTLRLPASDKVYRRTKDFGGFPLLEIADFKDRVPSGMLKKGGYFIPMLQRESLGILFEGVGGGYSVEAFAIRMFAGSINVASRKAAGHPTQPGDSDQDYIVVPKQKRLDGIQIGKGVAQQFVAMPLSWRYSLEQQLTGGEYIGGIQLQIAPALKKNVRFCRRRDTAFEAENSNPTLDVFKCPREEGVSSVHMTVPGYIRRSGEEDNAYKAVLGAREDGCGLIGRFLDGDFRTQLVHELELHQAIDAQSTAENPVVLRPVEALTIMISISTTDLSRLPQSHVLTLSPLLDLKHLVRILQKDFIDSNICESIAINGRFLEDIIQDCPNYQLGYFPLAEIAPGGGAILVRLRAEKKAGPYPTPNLPPFEYPDEVPSNLESYYDYNRKFGRQIFRRTLGGEGRGFKGDQWEMGIGAHARIQQSIMETNDPRLWNWKKSRFINIQIVNAVAFKSITGLSPLSPIPLKLPEQATLTKSYLLRTAPNLDSGSSTRTFKSISDIDAEERINVDLRARTNERMSGCASCELNFCNVV